MTALLQSNTVPTEIFNMAVMERASVHNDQRHIAIAEVTLFSIIQLVQFTTRFMQEWRYWHHRKRKSVARCIFYSWFGMLGLLAQMRIGGSAMVLATAQPSKAVVIAEYVLQHIGLSPLLFEVSLLLLRSGQVEQTGPGHSRYPKHLRFVLHAFRFPVIISLVVVVIGGSMDISACKDVGTVVFVLTFAFVIGLVCWMSIAFRTHLPKIGCRGVLLVLASLPFLVVRVVYFVLGEYGPKRYNASTGSTDARVAMGLLMELIIVILLWTARAVMEPILPAATSIERLEE